MIMQESVYLVISRQKVERMTKNPPDLRRGEIVVRVLVKVAAEAFREPTLVREIEVTDALDGMHLPDVELTQPFITQAEADRIKAQRRKEMISLLEKQGFTVLPPPEEE